MSSEAKDKTRTDGPKCPLCGRSRSPEHKPFCSARCADIDLHRWLSGRYRVPTDEAPGDAEAAEREAEES